jgi:hypothetical protein
VHIRSRGNVFIHAFPNNERHRYTDTHTQADGRDFGGTPFRWVEVSLYIHTQADGRDLRSTPFRWVEVS